jgi:hypothetical protein
MAEIINIKDRMPKHRGSKMFTLSFYQKGGRWTVDVDEISMAYENADIDAIMADIHLGVSKIEQHLRDKEKK